MPPGRPAAWRRSLLRRLLCEVAPWAEWSGSSEGKTLACSSRLESARILRVFSPVSNLLGVDSRLQAFREPQSLLVPKGPHGREPGGPQVAQHPAGRVVRRL